MTTLQAQHTTTILRFTGSRPSELPIFILTKSGIQYPVCILVGGLSVCDSTNTAKDLYCKQDFSIILYSGTLSSGTSV